ncbi:hypothetical protein IJT93_02950 [bacterium]|nr:hypothetical protein [bacterium]
MKLINIINRLGRAIEFLLTGQTDFRVITSDFVKAEIIDNEVQAKMAMQEVNAYLKKNFSISLSSPVVLRLGEVKTLDWKARLAARFKHLGNYTSKQLGELLTHEITIVPGLERVKFQSVLCHELVHAFQVERGLLKHFKGYREGMSRWAEYHFLCDHHRQDEAKRLKTFEMIIFGHMLNRILSYEARSGRQATCRWLAEMKAEN